MRRQQPIDLIENSEDAKRRKGEVSHQTDELSLPHLPELVKINILKMLGIQYVGRLQVNRRLRKQLKEISQGEDHNYWNEQYQHEYPAAATNPVTRKSIAFFAPPMPLSRPISYCPAYVEYRKQRVLSSPTARLRYYILCDDFLAIRKMKLQELDSNALHNVAINNLELAFERKRNVIFQYLYALFKVKYQPEFYQMSMLSIVVKYGTLAEVKTHYTAATEDRMEHAFKLAFQLNKYEMVKYFLTKDKKYLTLRITCEKVDCTPLAAAIRKADWTMMQLLRQQGASLEPTLANGLIEAAAESNRIEIVKEVVDWYEEAAEEVRDDMELVEALSIAVAKKNREICALLRAQNVTDETLAASIEDEDGYTLVHAAATHDDPDFVREVLGWYPAHLHATILTTYDDEELPIHVAARCNHPSLIEYFHQINPTLIFARIDESGRRPIEVAAEAGSAAALQKIIQLLRRHMTDEQLAAVINVHAVKDYSTPLVFAVGSKSKECVRLLLGAGADVNLTCRNGYSALHEAAWRGHVEILNLLIERSARLNGQARDTVEEADYVQLSEALGTPIEIAIKNMHVDCVRALVRAGADVTDALLGLYDEQYHYYPLYRAQIESCSANEIAQLHVLAEIVYVLVDAGTPFIFYEMNNTTYGYNFNDYHPAEFDSSRLVCSKSPEFLLLLAGELAIERANVTLLNRLLSEVRPPVNVCWNYHTPLCAAVFANNIAIARMFMRAGANANLSSAKAGFQVEFPQYANRCTLTPIELAAVMGHAQMVLFLLIRGAHFDAKKILSLAEQSGDADTINLLTTYIPIQSQMESGTYSLISICHFFAVMLQIPYDGDQDREEQGDCKVARMFNPQVSAKAIRRALIMQLEEGFIADLTQLFRLIQDYKNVIHPDKCRAIVGDIVRLHKQQYHYQQPNRLL